MLDKNIVLLEGLIGDDFSYHKTKEGKDMCAFSICVNSFIKEIADMTERTHSQQFIRILVFDARQVEYLKRLNAHQGQRVTVFGRLASRSTEYKGIAIRVNCVVSRDVQLIKLTN